MVYAKNYETMSTFVKVMQKKKIWPLFSGHGAYCRMRAIDLGVSDEWCQHSTFKMLLLLLLLTMMMMITMQMNEYVNFLHVLMGLLSLSSYRVVQKNGTPNIFCDNFRKCTPILTIFSLLEPEIDDA